MLALAAPLAHASALVPVADQDGMCPRFRTGFCHEWALEADPRLRVLFRGFADGASHSLYRRGALGQYYHLFDFVPVLQDGDDEAQELQYLGDATTLDLATATDRNVVLFASFDVPWERARAESMVRPLPPWQQRKPALLFKGATSVHATPVARQRFAPMTPVKVRKASKRVRTHCVTPSPADGPLQPCR